VAGGMESMSNAPYLLAKRAAVTGLGHARVYDHMFLDGLEDAYDRGTLMGKFAEDTAQHYQFTRELRTHSRLASLAAPNAPRRRSRFASEIVPVRVG
jgi:acetyl-CoA C-acetyltransferase